MLLQIGLDDLTLILEGIAGAMPEIVGTLSRMAETRYVEARVIAEVLAALGNIDQAIESVARSLDEREPFSAFLKLDPAFDPLRGDPRFAELVSSLGL